MSISAPYRRVQLDATLGGADGSFGDWGATVNISAALPNSLGKPLDWWVRGSVAGAISGGIRKLNSPNLFTVSILNPTDGQPADAGALADWAAGTITWTDGPTGAGSSTKTHQLDGPNGLGGGFRIAVPAPMWPDWYLLKVWTRDFAPRRMRYKATLDNARGSIDEVWIDYTTPGPSSIAIGDNILPWTNNARFSSEVKFASDEVGRTLTFDITKTREYYQGLYAVALYRAAINTFPASGGRRIKMLSGAL